MLLQINGKLLRNNALHRSPGFTVSQLLLRLPFKLGLFDLNADDGRHSLPDVISHKVLIRIFDQLIRPGIIVKSFCQGVLKSGKMRSPLRSRNIVYKAVASLCIGIIMLHGHFHIDAIPFPFTVDDIRVQRCFPPV